jgi:hypothetical protein
VPICTSRSRSWCLARTWPKSPALSFRPVVRKRCRGVPGRRAQDGDEWACYCRWRRHAPGG